MKQKYVFFWNYLAFSVIRRMLAIWSLATLPFLSPACTSERFRAYLTLEVSASLRHIMLKILQARLQQYVNHELPDVQVDLDKAEEPEIKLPTSDRSSKKQERSRKTSTSLLLTIPKPLIVWTTKTGKFFKRWEYQTTRPASWETCMQLRKQRLELDMGQQAGSK